VGLLQTQMSIVVACHNGYMCKHTHKCVSCHRIVWANCERQTIDAPHQMFFAMQRKDSADKQSELWVGMLKAACLRACGNATPTNEQMTQMPPTDPVRTCARSLVNILVRLAEAYETLETPDIAESALRQALEVCSFCNRLLGSCCCLLMCIFLASRTR